MMKSTVILLFANLIGVVTFLVLPGGFWILAAGLILVLWLSYLLVVVPNQAHGTRARSAFLACFVIMVVLAASRMTGSSACPALRLISINPETPSSPP